MHRPEGVQGSENVYLAHSCDLYVRGYVDALDTQLKSLLERCRRATKKRNDLTHTVTFHHLGSKILKRTDGRKAKRNPSIDELESLARELNQLAVELNKARMTGFLAEALADKK